MSAPTSRSGAPRAPSAAPPAPMAPAASPAPSRPPLSGAARTYADGLRRAARICVATVPDDSSNRAWQASIRALKSAADDMLGEAAAAEAGPGPGPALDPRIERLAARLCARWGGGTVWQQPMAMREAGDFLAMWDEMRAIEDERTAREAAR